MNVAHHSHHVTLLQKILVTRESSWGWKARKSIRSWQNPKRYRSCFLGVTTVFILVLFSSLPFSAGHAGSIVYTSFLGTIPCPPCVHDYKITIIFPVEIPWHIFFIACQSYSLLYLLEWADSTYSWLLPLFQDMKALTQLPQTSTWCTMIWITESKKIGCFFLLWNRWGLLCSS